MYFIMSLLVLLSSLLLVNATSAVATAPVNDDAANVPNNMVSVTLTQARNPS